MPKNIKGGNKAKKGKNCRFREERQLDLATDGQYYGICTKYYGSARGDVTYICNNGTEESEISALGIIRGFLIIHLPFLNFIFFSLSLTIRKDFLYISERSKKYFFGCIGSPISNGLISA